MLDGIAAMQKQISLQTRLDASPVGDPEAVGRRARRCFERSQRIDIALFHYVMHRELMLESEHEGRRDAPNKYISAWQERPCVDPRTGVPVESLPEHSGTPASYSILTVLKAWKTLPGLCPSSYFEG